MFVVSFLVGYCLVKSDILSNSEVSLPIFTKVTPVTQEFEHFEGREIGQLWWCCDKSYGMLRNVAYHSGNAETLKEGFFLLRIPIFKDNGLL